MLRSENITLKLTTRIRLIEFYNKLALSAVNFLLQLLLFFPYIFLHFKLLSFLKRSINDHENSISPATICYHKIYKKI